MYPMPFDYEVAESVDHAIDLLGEHGDESKLIAGGHSLIPLMRLRLAAPTVLIDLDRLEDLRYVREEEDYLAIGALTRHRQVLNNPLVQEHCGILSFTAGLLGDPSVQHRGTIGGALAHGDPSGDLPNVVATLGAELDIKGPDGERTVRAADFFQDYFVTDLDEQEVVTEVRVPKLGPNTGWSYKKFSRRSQDWAIVGVAAVVEKSNGSIDSARVGLTSMGPPPTTRPRPSSGATWPGCGPGGPWRRPCLVEQSSERTPGGPAPRRFAFSGAFRAAQGGRLPGG